MDAGVACSVLIDLGIVYGNLSQSQHLKFPRHFVHLHNLETIFTSDSSFDSYSQPYFKMIYEQDKWFAIDLTNPSY